MRLFRTQVNAWTGVDVARIGRDSTEQEQASCRRPASGNWNAALAYVVFLLWDLAFNSFPRFSILHFTSLYISLHLSASRAFLTSCALEVDIRSPTNVCSARHKLIR
jgi:hypothetical protein